MNVHICICTEIRTVLMKNETFISYKIDWKRYESRRIQGRYEVGLN